MKAKTVTTKQFERVKVLLERLIFVSMRDWLSIGTFQLFGRFPVLEECGVPGHVPPIFLS